jgi:CP family cyanate transporter-like MFS transporter
LLFRKAYAVSGQTTQDESIPSGPRRWLSAGALRVAGVLAVAIMLRPSVAGIGPIIDDIRDGLSLPSAAVSLLTALPVLCFAGGSFIAPALTRRLGIDVSIAVALGLLTASLIVRSLGGAPLLFTGTFVSGAAIAVANVVLPRLVKQDFPAHAGLMTGLYTAALGISAAVAALIAVPLESWTGHGWQGSLSLWGLIGGVVFVIWLPQTLARHAPDPSALSTAHPAKGLLRNRQALALTGFMGLQSLSYYVPLAWLPSLLSDDAGYSHTAAGAYLSLLTGLGIPMSLIIPALAARRSDQRLFAVGATAIVWIGYLGLLIAPGTATLLWVVLLGIGTGSTFPLTLLMMVLRASTPTVAGQLSAMSQGIGYLICAIGPFLVGVLHDASNSWRPSLVLMLVLVALQAATGAVVGRAGIAA